LSSSPPTNPFDNHRTYCIWGFGKEFTMIQSRYIFSRLVCVVHANDRSAPVQRGFYDFPIDSHRRSSRLREELKKYCTARTERSLSKIAHSSRPHSSKGVQPPQSGGGSAIFPSVTRRSATRWWPPASARMDEIETAFALTG
jgi:hypothetical protein